MPEPTTPQSPDLAPIFAGVREIRAALEELARRLGVNPHPRPKLTLVKGGDDA
jgi:hypothetical protein